MQDLTIFVATHKPYWMPSDSVYAPLYVGAAMRPDSVPDGYMRDDSGENISDKNASFCELTGLYWAWKNLDAPYLGLAHYRRYFACAHFGDRKERIATGEQLMAALGNTSVILPNKRNYYIETNYSQYVHAHNEADLAHTRAIISERAPEYLAAYDESMGRRTGHRFNMFIMRRDLLDEYCSWLFDILFELEQRLDTSSYSDNDKRVFGFVSERLLDPWIETRGIGYAEMPVVHLESQRWLSKGANFLKRKFAGK